MLNTLLSKTLPSIAADLRRAFALPHRRLTGQAGTTTAEYAIGTLAACGFAAVLYKIVTSGSVSALLSGIIHKALGAVG